VEPTSDPAVQIEDRGPGWVIYRRNDGARWIVRGTCDRRGLCLIGSVIDGVEVEDLDHLAELVKIKGQDRIDSELDVPVTPEFHGCCPLVGEYLGD